MAGSDYKLYGIIYCVLHRESGKRYIGQTTNTIEYRWSKHCGTSKTCRRLANAIAKYGKDAFDVFEIDRASTKEDLDAKEVHYIAHFKSNECRFGYNIMPGGGKGKHAKETCELIASALRGKKLSEEHCKKLSIAHLGHKRSIESRMKQSATVIAANKPFTKERINKISLALTGKTRGPLSEEHKAKLSAVRKGRKKGPLSEETKAKLSAAMAGRKRAPFSDETRARISESAKKRGISEETRQKMRDGRKGLKQSPEHIAKRMNAMRGQKRSEETKLKMSESTKRYYENKRQVDLEIN